MTGSAIRPTTIKIDQATKERMQRLAEARNRSPHWMMLEAIRQYVAQGLPSGRDQGMERVTGVGLACDA